MGLLADVKLYRKFKRLERQAAGQVNTPNNPLVSIIGHEKVWGKPAPHDFKTFVANLQSWAFVCAYKNALSVAKVPISIFKRVKGEDNQEELEQITDHPFLDLMRNVNPHYNRLELMTITQVFIDVTGNAYWWVVRDNLRVPRILWPIPAHWMKIVPSKETFVAGYVMTVPGSRGEKIPFDVEEIIHFRFPGPFDMHYGTPPMYGATHDVALNEQIKKYGINFLMNNAQPSGVLQTEDSITDQQYKRLQTMWKMRYQGTSNAGKIAILEKGLTFNKIGSNLAEMSFQDTERSIRDGILAAFGVPASKLGLVEDVNRANAEANDYTYQKETILPRLILIQEKLNEKLMPMYDQGLVTRFDNPVPEDKAFRLKEQREHIVAGYASIDEERERDGLDPLNLPETKVPLIPFNVIPAGMDGFEPEEPAEPGDEPERAITKDTRARRRRKWEMFAQITGPQERMFAISMRRFFGAQRRQVMSNINKYRQYSKEVKVGLDAGILFIMKEENERLAGRAKPYINEAYRSGVELGYKELGTTVDFNLISPNIRRSIDQRIRFFSEKVNNSTVRLLQQAIEQGVGAGESIDAIAGRVGKVFDFSEAYRSKRIAQTEVIGAANDGQLEAYKENGVERKEWITARDERVRDSHIAADGQVVGITENFKLGSGVLIQYPGDRSGMAPPGEVINCRCVVNPIVTKE